MNLNPLSWISGTVSAVADGVTKVSKTFVGSKEDRDKQDYESFINTQNEFGGEFNRKTTTWWDSMWDGFNRAPRPVIVALVIAYFLFSYINPEEFQVLNISLQTVPEKMWYVLSAIIGFYFCAREMHKIREGKMALTDDQFQKMQTRIKKIRQSKENEEEKIPDHVKYILQ